MQLSASDEVLRGAFRRLAAVAPNTAIDWSDSWTDSDLQDFTAASVSSREAVETEDSVERRTDGTFDTNS